VKDAPVIVLGDTTLPELGRPIDNALVRDAVEVHTHLPGWLRGQVTAYEVTDDHGLVLQLRVPPRDPDGEPTTVPVRFGTARDLALKVEVIRVLLPEAVERGGSLDVRAPANPVVVPST
jgi:hypothetical protein